MIRLRKSVLYSVYLYLEESGEQNKTQCGRQSRQSETQGSCSASGGGAGTHRCGGGSIRSATSD